VADADTDEVGLRRVRSDLEVPHPAEGISLIADEYRPRALFCARRFKRAGMGRGWDNPRPSV
jgi:hypothetical protein